MFCSKRGNTPKDEDLFCRLCGNSVNKPQPDDDEVETAQAEDEELLQQEDEALQQEESCEKLVFGIGTIIFSAVIVLLLSVACGIFSGLYFSEREKNISRAAVVVEEEMPW